MAQKPRGLSVGNLEYFTAQNRVRASDEEHGETAVRPAGCKDDEISGLNCPLTPALSPLGGERESGTGSGARGDQRNRLPVLRTRR